MRAVWQSAVESYKKPTDELQRMGGFLTAWQTTKLKDNHLFHTTFIDGNDSFDEQDILATQPFQHSQDVYQHSQPDYTAGHIYQNQSTSLAE